MIREWLRLEVSQTRPVFQEKRGDVGGIMDDLTAGNYNASGLVEPQVWTLLRLATYPS